MNQSMLWKEEQETEKNKKTTDNSQALHDDSSHVFAYGAGAGKG
ncbi:MAG: hypothetical protein U0O33_01345 [Blautia sp.]